MARHPRSKIEKPQREIDSLWSYNMGTFRKLLLISSSRRLRVRLRVFCERRIVYNANGSSTGNSVKCILAIVLEQLLAFPQWGFSNAKIARGHNLLVLAPAIQKL
jgi:hypothetical protein